MEYSEPGVAGIDFNPYLDQRIPRQATSPKSIHQPPTTSRLREYQAVAASIERRLARREQMEGALKYFYEENPALSPNNIAAVEGAEQHYVGVLSGNSNVGKHLRHDMYSKTSAAIAFAAASILRQRTGGLIPSRQAADALLKNRHQAWKYFLENQQVLMYPNGVWDLPDHELARYAGIRREELAELGDEHKGLGYVPAVLATLAADMVHSEQSPILGVRSINQRLEAKGALIDGEIKRLKELDERKGTRLALARMLNMSDDEKKAWREFKQRIENTRARQMQEIATRAVLEAARIRYGYVDSDLVDVLAECLVAEAHNFTDIPAGVRDVLAVRMAEAAHKCNVNSSKELPESAAPIFATFMKHARELNYRPGTLSSWLGLTAFDGFLKEV